MEDVNTRSGWLTPIAPPYRFDVDSRRDLHSLELIDEQIAALEEALPACQAMITDAPPLLEVRDNLEGLEKAGRLLAKAIGKSPAGTEVMWRLQKAAYEDGLDCAEIERACAVLLPLARLAKSALKELPAEQRRPKAGEHEPVRLIHNALILGWYRGRPGEELNLTPRRRGQSALRNFQKIVGICYREMGAPPGHFPERAYKSFLRQRKGEGRR